MSTPSRLSAVVIDCADPVTLAEFYRIATGWQIIHADADSARLSNGGGVSLRLRRVEGYRGPGRSAAAAHFHLDLTYPDVPERIHRLLAAGATQPGFQPGGAEWIVLADPEGHRLRVCRE